MKLSKAYENYQWFDSAEKCAESFLSSFKSGITMNTVLEILESLRNAAMNHSQGGPAITMRFAYFRWKYGYRQ